MLTSVEVMGKIKEMSGRTVNPQHRILMHDMAAELQVPQDRLLVLLTELENRGLIRVHKSKVVSVSLTNYGLTEQDPEGGLDSE